MNYINIEKQYNKILHSLYNNNIIAAIKRAVKLSEESKKNDFLIQLNNYEEIYLNIIKYTIQGVNDPEREKIFSNLLVSIVKLVDELRGDLLGSLNIESYREKVKTKRYYLQNKENIFNENNEIREKSINDIFLFIWLNTLLDNEETDLIKKINLSEINTWTEKSLIVSAVSISLLKSFDIKKIDILFSFYLEKQEKVWQRALVGLVLAFYHYRDRLSMYPDILEKIKTNLTDDDAKKNIELVAIQLIKSRETEKISRKLRDEIFPEMEKIKPQIEEKLNLDNILTESFSEEKNPDWENIFEDAPDLLNKMEEFSMLQIEGSDVFHSAFSMLKHFPFFNKINNWLVPFYADNTELIKSLKSIDNSINTNIFTDNFEHAAFLCNSDKYSFCFNLAQMPEMQRSMMFDLFKAELEGMNEISKDEKLLNMSASNKYIFTQYIQDLYRFYKLFPAKKQFPDIFGSPFIIYDSQIFNLTINDVSIRKNIAQFYFEKNYYSDALATYLQIIDEGVVEQVIYEKIGYCYQMQKKYKSALDYYIKAELFDTNQVWNLKKIAMCYRQLSKHELALEYYLKAEKHDTENLYVQANIGHCYLNLKDYENALKHYFKVEYYDPSNIAILRPIAWCAFVSGKIDVSKKYYSQLIEKEANKYDYLNIGNLELCSGSKSKAIDYYQKSIKFKDNSLKKFMKDFNEDRKFLSIYKIDNFDIQLIIEYLKHLEYAS